MAEPVQNQAEPEVSDDPQVISKKEYIILVDNRKESRVLNLRTEKTITLRKQRIDLRQLIGKKYDTVYEVDKGNLKVMNEGYNEFYNIEQGGQIDELMETEQKDNRNMISYQEAEKLGKKVQLMEKDEIEIKKRDETITKQELVEEIASKNPQIEQRTQYSLQKYLKKKKKRHFFMIMIRKCTLENIQHTMYTFKPKDIGYLREDSFAYFLFISNVVKGSRVLIFDNTRGLALAGIAQRLKGQGKIDLCHHPSLDTNQRKNTCLFHNAMNPDKDVQGSVRLLSSDQLLENKSQYSHLLIAGDYDQVEIVTNAYQKLAIGGQFCAYSPHIENLIPVYEFLYNTRQFIYLQLTDSFMRQYQVLKNRTHPVVETSNFSGYILRAIKVETK